VSSLLVVRHGQSVWNADGRWQGQADPPLSLFGEEQAAAAAPRIDGVSAVYTSDLVRALRTAEIIAARLGIPVAADPRLRERQAGPWQGKTRAEIEAAWPGYLASGRRPPEYEDDDSVLARVLPALAAIAERSRKANAVLVVTHAGVVRTVERHLGADVDGPLPNLGGRWIHHDGTRSSLGERALLLDEARVTRPEQL
jgi:broad specificity phosphatase PhoE